MNILFFGYWGANEGLSQATIIPHLETLSEFKQVEKILFVSIERKEESSYQIPKHSKIRHFPYVSPLRNDILRKLDYFLKVPFFLKGLIKKERIDLLMCRSSLAGGIGYWTYRLTGIPFTVESFEPHADYMADLRIWSKNGISYNLQKYLETKQKKYSFLLMPITYLYKEKLLREGVEGKKILVLPCTVNVDQFAFSKNTRRDIREKLKVKEDAYIGIYVGKFGGMYWDTEAFKLFKEAFQYFESFELILLNSQPRSFIKGRCEEAEIPFIKVHHLTVKHNEVPQYLSAADFAFSLHRNSRFSSALSPIKNGEYWANGLPVIGPTEVGDDSRIIAEEGVGLLIENDIVEWSDIDLRRNSDSNRLCVEIAKKYRDRSLIKGVYEQLLSKLI